MEKAINNAIKLLAEKIKGNIDSGDALRFSQAALNLQHIFAVQAEIKKISKPFNRE